MHTPRSTPIAVSPDFIAQLIPSIDSSNYIGVSLLALVLYDIATSLDKEVKYFWNRPRLAVTWLYFVNRYAVVLGAVINVLENSMHANAFICHAPAYILTFLNLASILSIDYILLLRVCALYSQDKVITTVLRIFFGLEALIEVALNIYTNITVLYGVTEPVDEISICIIQYSLTQGPILGVISWAIPSVYGFILMTLALKQATVFWRESSGLTGLRLIKILIRDQAVYFVAVIFVTLSESTSSFVNGHIPALILSIVGGPPILSIVGSRMLFHMKEAGEQGINTGTSYRPRAAYSIDFTDSPVATVDVVHTAEVA